MSTDLTQKGNKIAIIRLSDELMTRKFSDTFTFLKSKILREYGLECTALTAQISHDFLASNPEREIAEIPLYLIWNDLNKALISDEIAMIVLCSENYSRVSENSGTYSYLQKVLSEIDYNAIQTSEKPIIMYQEGNLNHLIHYKGGASSLIYQQGLNGEFSEFISPNVITIDSAQKTVNSLVGLSYDNKESLSDKSTVFESEMNVFKNIATIISQLEKTGLLKTLNDSFLLGHRDELTLNSEYKHK